MTLLWTGAFFCIFVCTEAFVWLTVELIWVPAKKKLHKTTHSKYTINKYMPMHEQIPHKMKTH